MPQEEPQSQKPKGQGPRYSKNHHSPDDQNGSSSRATSTARPSGSGIGCYGKLPAGFNGACTFITRKPCGVLCGSLRRQVAQEGGPWHVPAAQESVANGVTRPFSPGAALSWTGVACSLASKPGCRRQALVSWVLFESALVGSVTTRWPLRGRKKPSRQHCGR